MADDEGTDVDVTHDVFLIHANEPSEDKEFAPVSYTLTLPTICSV